MVKFSRSHRIRLMARRTGATDASFSDEDFGRLNESANFNGGEKLPNSRI